MQGKQSKLAIKDVKIKKDGFEKLLSNDEKNSMRHKSLNIREI